MDLVQEAAVFASDPAKVAAIVVPIAAFATFCLALNDKVAITARKYAVDLFNGKRSAMHSYRGGMVEDICVSLGGAAMPAVIGTAAVVLTM
jgi:hypothetical protein